MVRELSHTQIEAYQDYFSGPLATWAIASVAAGNTAGCLWLAEGNGPEPTLLLCDQGNNVFYLAGAAPAPATRDILTRLIAEELRPAAVAQGLARFKVRALAPALEELVSGLFAGADLHAAASAVYLFEASPPSAVPMPALPGFQLLPIDQALLGHAGLEGCREVLEEIRWMWPDPDRFYREGFGVAACVPGAVVGWCTAEYVSPGRCGVGIATVPAFEGQSVATAMAAHFVALCHNRGIVPLWETATANLGSRRVAEKVGFTLAAESESWIGTFTSNTTLTPS